MTFDMEQITALNGILTGEGMRATIDASRQASAILQTDQTDPHNVTQWLDSVPVGSQQLVPTPGTDVPVGGIRLSRPLQKPSVPAGLYAVIARTGTDGITVPVLINEAREPFSAGIDADLTVSTVRISRSKTDVAPDGTFYNFQTQNGSWTLAVRIGFDALITPTERTDNEAVITSAAQKLGIAAEINLGRALRGTTGGAMVVAAPASRDPRWAVDGSPEPGELLGVFEAFGPITTSNQQTVGEGIYAVYGYSPNKALLRSEGGEFPVDAHAAAPWGPSSSIGCICVCRWCCCC
jgi:hypothetical protein